MDLTVFFCGNCGSTIYKKATEKTFHGVIVLLAGTVDGGDGVEAAPERELWIKYRADWVQPVAGALQDLEFPQ